MSNWACEKCQTAKSRCKRPSSGGGPCDRCVDRRIECHLTPIKPRRPNLKSHRSKSNAVLDAKKVQKSKCAAVRERHTRRNEFDSPLSADTATQVPTTIQAPVMEMGVARKHSYYGTILQSLGSHSGDTLNVSFMAYIHALQLSAQMPSIGPDFSSTSSGNIDASSIFNSGPYSATDAGFELHCDTANESNDTITAFPSPTLTSTSNADAEANYRGAIQANAVHNTLLEDPGMPFAYADSLGLGFGAPVSAWTGAPQNFDVDRPTGGFGYY